MDVKFDDAVVITAKVLQKARTRLNFGELNELLPEFGLEPYGNNRGLAQAISSLKNKLSQAGDSGAEKAVLYSFTDKNDNYPWDTKDKK